MPVNIPYTQYTGIWNLSAASKAKGAGTWPTPPAIRLYSWGNGVTGALGLGNSTYYSSPKQVGALSDWLSISAGAYFVASIKTDGTLWSWGKNNHGQLALGNTTNYSSPKQVGALTNWLETSCGRYHCLALKTDGTIWSWGRNNNGQLGLNISTLTNRSSPSQIGSSTDWDYISAGGNSNGAIKTDGTLWTWGYNADGQLGIGVAPGTNFSSPVQVGALTNWLRVSVGYYHMFATKTDGTLWSWGGNLTGPLGLGNQTDYSSPKQIGSLTNWGTISAGLRRSYSVKTDGTLWSWGNGNTGALGLGNTTSYSSPKQVGALTNWSKAQQNPSGSHVLSYKTDGTLWSWGQGYYGALGLGNTTYYSSPKQVGALTTWLAIGAGPYASYGIAVN
jgi:alpha-tubulin suppressor-like RCC1 family protein